MNERFDVAAIPANGRPPLPAVEAGGAATPERRKRSRASAEREAASPRPAFTARERQAPDSGDTGEALSRLSGASSEHPHADVPHAVGEVAYLALDRESRGPAPVTEGQAGGPRAKTMRPARSAPARDDE